MYVIHKKSRNAENQSYSGITWDVAGIRKHYQPQFESKEWACDLANILSDSNPVGFVVSKV